MLAYMLLSQRATERSTHLIGLLRGSPGQLPLGTLISTVFDPRHQIMALLSPFLHLEW